MLQKSRAGWHPRPVPVRRDAPPLILFDGVCNLCSFWVGFVIRRDRDQVFRFVPAQSDAGHRLMAACGIDIDHPESNIVLSSGTACFKSDAALAVLACLPGWRWTRILKALPRPLRDWLYDRVARNRYALFGRKESCLMPTPDVRSRFIVEADNLPRLEA
jgi:predicted DCC family thiol-disulfide oxidoreductase YuxK